MRELDPELLRRLEAQARDIGHLIGAHLGGKVNGRWQTGFALLIFSFAGPEFTYISNADRQDMIRTLEELLGNLKKGPLDDIRGEKLDESRHKSVLRRRAASVRITSSLRPARK